MKVEFIHGTVSDAAFGDMFGGWLTEYEGKNFMVDCGVGEGAATLAERLSARLDGRGLDFVLLTHIHLDHAGGLEEILKKWPGVKVVTHEKGLPYLTEPEKLWSSTQKVMREYAPMYGRPPSLPEAAFIPHTRADIPGLVIFETPGHAQHHLSFRLGDAMFAGEAGGCPLLFQGRICNRPSTPPPFFADQAFKSIDLLLKEKDEEAYFGHTHYMLPFREILERYRAQLGFWIDFLKSPDASHKEGEGRRAYLSRLTEFLFREDPDMSPLAALPPRQLVFEKFFINNAIEGILKSFGEESRARLAAMKE